MIKVMKFASTEAEVLVTTMIILEIVGMYILSMVCCLQIS